MAMCCGENIIFGPQAVSLNYYYTHYSARWSSIKSFFKGVFNKGAKATKG